MLAKVSFVRLPPVQAMPLFQELSTDVSLDTVGQVCALTSAMAIKVNVIARPICLVSINFIIFGMIDFAKG